MDISGGHKLALRVTAEDAVHTEKNIGGTIRVGALRAGSKLDHRRDESSGNAMARDIRDKQASLVFTRYEKVEEVSCNRRHRQIARRHSKAA
jgi:hypothetical protein